MDHNDDTLQKGLMWLLGSLVTAFLAMLGWRSTNRISNENKSDNRQSVFQENMQTRLDAALARADAAEARAREALDGRALLERKLSEADRNMVLLLGELETEARQRVERYVHNSRLADLDDLPHPKKK